MPRGNWRRLYPAIIASAILTAGGSGYWLLSDAVHQQSVGEEKAASYAYEHGNSAEEQAEPNCSSVTPLSAELECYREARQRARPAIRDEYDLEAQRTMAAWTRAMGIAAVVGMVVGIIGVSLIWTTFRETRRAAVYAGIGARQGRRSANASIAAAEAAISSYRVQVRTDRPILLPEADESFFGLPPFPDPYDQATGLSQVISHMLVFKNIGTQPCWLERCWVNIWALPHGDAPTRLDRFPRDAFAQAHAGIVKPQGVYNPGGSGYWRIPEWQFEVIKGNSLPTIYYGLCQYRGPSGTIFGSRFAYYLNTSGNQMTLGLPVGDAEHWKDGILSRARWEIGDQEVWAT